MEYTIGEFSKRTNLGIHTLRYYEKEQLLKPSRRDNGRRYYTELDLTWITFIKRLKDTGMPLKEIRVYACLRETGDSTMRARQDLLLSHRDHLSNQLTELQEHIKKLDEKIMFYEQQILQKGSL